MTDIREILTLVDNIYKVGRYTLLRYLLGNLEKEELVTHYIKISIGYYLLRYLPENAKDKYIICIHQPGSSLFDAFHCYIKSVKEYVIELFKEVFDSSKFLEEILLAESKGNILFGIRTSIDSLLKEKFSHMDKNNLYCFAGELFIRRGIIIEKVNNFLMPKFYKHTQINYSGFILVIDSKDLENCIDAIKLLLLHNMDSISLVKDSKVISDLESIV